MTFASGGGVTRWVETARHVDHDRPADDVERDRPQRVVLARDVFGEQRDEVALGQVGLAHRGDPREPEVTERHACLVDARHHGLLARPSVDATAARSRRTKTSDAPSP